MRISRFFVNEPLQLGEYEAASYLVNYIGRVLRLTVGSSVQLFDGSGIEFLGHITEITKKKIIINWNILF